MQTTIDNIEDLILKASLGYAMMDVMSDDDLGRGPKMIAQTINVRGINESYLKEFRSQVRSQGLHNKDVQNAILIGVNAKDIKLSSLQPMKAGHYTNVVEWSHKIKREKAQMLLYNGNHRRTYMRSMSGVTTTYRQYLHIMMDLQKPQSDEMRASLKKAEEAALAEVEEHGKWLVHFVDKGE